MSAVLLRFNDNTREVTIGDVTQTLRPKTFQLAQFLAARYGEVISKEEMLASLWRDNVVEEQAIFQSINEIRKAFAPTEVIKTYPRKGYTWLIPGNDDVSGEAEPESDKSIKPSTSVLATLVIGVLLLTAGISGWLYRVGIDAEVSENVEAVATGYQGLLVMPFGTSNLDSSQRWLRYGAMDAVISQFEGQSSMTLFQTDDVLDIIKRRSDSEEQPELLFDVSGATIIVDSDLSGVPGEYVLTYTIYQRQSRVQGILQGKTTDILLNQLAAQIQDITSIPANERSLHYDQLLSDTLMFNAMQFLVANDLPSATSFLESAVLSSPDNPDGYFWLSKVYLMQGKAGLALEKAQAGLNKLSADTGIHFSRLLYLKGNSLLNLGAEHAQQTLHQALDAAKTNDDWLYVSYAKSMLGYLYIQNGRTDLAFPLLSDALSYQQMLNCPMGVAQAHLDLVDYYLATQQSDKARFNLNTARQLVKSKQLTQVEPLLKRKASQVETL